MLKSLPKQTANKKQETEKKQQPKKSNTGNNNKAGASKEVGKSNGGETSSTTGSNDDILGGWSKCAVQVSKILSAEPHPSAEQLYVIQLEVGADKPRQVCAGLVK